MKLQLIASDNTIIEEIGDIFSMIYHFPEKQGRAAMIAELKAKRTSR